MKAEIIETPLKSEFETQARLQGYEVFDKNTVCQLKLAEKNIINKSLTEELSHEGLEQLEICKSEINSLKATHVVSDETLRKELLFYRKKESDIEKASGHKYFKREPKAGGGYKYYYTESEYKQANDKGEKGKSNVWSKDQDKAIADNDKKFSDYLKGKNIDPYSKEASNEWRGSIWQKRQKEILGKEKVKSPSDKNLTKDEKLEIAKYFSKENSFELALEKAKRELTPMELIDLLKFHGMRKKEQIHNDDMGTNPSYKVYQTEKLTKEQADVDATLFNVIGKDTYYKNAKKNVVKQMITQSLRQYPNGLKEGVMIKKEPYSEAFTINVFGIDGDFVYDKGKNIAEGGKQIGKLYNFTSLPTDSEDLVNSMMAYEHIKRNHEGVEINTDITKFKAYPTSSEFFKQ